MTTYDASLYSNSYLNATGGNGPLYVRTATNLVNASMSSAVDLGTLVQNSTQLDVTSTLTRANSTDYYKLALDGSSMKLRFVNRTDNADGSNVGVRIQVMNSSGKVVADSSTFGTEANQTAYKNLTSSTGLKLKSGDYYVKVTYDSDSPRSKDQSYSLALYSGTRFNTSYQTTARVQTSTSQKVTTDLTMTYSTADAKSYSTNATHMANETATESQVNLGWIYENKSALSVTSTMTNICEEQYYSLTLQKGDNLKMAFTNKTDTSDLRVQLYDSTGTYLYADSDGTEAQKAAYEKLISSDGLSAKKGTYTVKVSYKQGETKSNQSYEMKVYSGDHYNTLYTTSAATEEAGTAILNGDFKTYSATAASASYMATQMSDNLDAVFYYLYQKLV